jgi:SGNH hydrolase-like domain, acetyltransferase AlgX
VITNAPVSRLPRAPSPPPPSAAAPEEPSPVFESEAYAWVRSRLRHGAPRAYNALARLRLWEPMGGEKIEEDDQLRVYKRRRQAQVEQAWTITERILQATAAEAASHGTRFAVVYVPSRMEVSDRDWDLTRLTYDLDEGVWDRGLVARRVTQMGQADGFPVLDLTPPLRDVTHRWREPYFVYDGHWNALGHRAAGEAVAGFLRDRGWVPPCATAAH